MKKKYLVLISCILLLAGCATPKRSNVRKIEPGVPQRSMANIAVSSRFEKSLESVLERKQSEVKKDIDRSKLGLDDYDLSFSDFDFYWDLLNGKIPDDAYYPSLRYAEGSWKYDFILRKEGNDGYYYEEMGYSELQLNYDKETVTIILHPRIATDGFEAWPLTDDDIGYEPFEGGFDENDQLKLIGNNAVINPTDYYDSSGREYFVGGLWISEEDVAVFMMTRGQN